MDTFGRREHDSTPYLLCFLRKEGMYIPGAANSSSSIEDTDGNCPANARIPNTTHSFDFTKESEYSRVIRDGCIQKEQISQSDSFLQGNSSSSFRISNFLFEEPERGIESHDGNSSIGYNTTGTTTNLNSSFSISL